MTENFYSHVGENLKKIEERISISAQKSGRSREDITLLAVTKTVEIEAINAAIDYGVTTIGENYVVELAAKASQVRCDDIHMIGHLQSNKIKQLLPHITMLQSLDSLRLAKNLEKELKKAQQNLEVLIEVNIAGEQSKTGISPEEAMELADYVLESKFLTLRGAMCIPPNEENSKIKKYFEDMCKLYIDIKRKKRHNIDNIDILSMGMSEDFDIAIEHGATLVRIGSAIFGKRN